MNMANPDRGSNGLNIIFEVSDTKFSLSLSRIREIVMLPEIINIPDKPASIRGSIKIREDLFTLIDLRELLGIPSTEEEDRRVLDMLEQRKQDHINWVKELLASIEEKKEFLLTTDPHACKFGQWYDHYHTDNIGLREYLKKFDRPHRNIHRSADKVEKLMANNDIEGAKRIIAELQKNELLTMQHLFDNFHRALRDSRRELAIVLSSSGKKLAIPVDNVLKIENFTGTEMQQATTLTGDLYEGFVTSGHDTYALLNTETLLTRSGMR